MQNDQPLDDAPIVVSEEDVWTCLHRIKPGKASGPDNLPNWILQKFAALLAAPIPVILNGSFKRGSVAFGLEVGKCLPNSQI